MKSHSLPWFLLFAFLFALQIIPRFWGDSLTNDEPMEITNGFYYLTQGDVLSHAKHPPFSKALQALPLLAFHLKEPQGSADAMNRAYTFFFRDNLGQLRAMTIGGRLSSLILGLGIGFLLFKITRKSPLPVLLFALSLWAFDPTISAFSGLALADIPVAFFFLASILAFKRSQEDGSWKPAFFAGILSGMAVTCKFSGLVLIPLFLILEIFSPTRRQESHRFKHNQKPKHVLRISGFPFFPLASWRLGGENFKKRWLWGTAGFGLWIFLLYLPGTLCLPGHLSPFHYFWDGFREMAGYKGHPVYFMGQVGRENHWAYFPVAFLIKNPLPFLALLGAGLGLMAFRRSQFPLWQWMPGVLFFAAIMPTQDLGIRYLLPAYPFFILVASQAAGWLWEKSGKKRVWKIALAGLALFQVASVGLNFPHPISYFNELVSPEGKFFWLGDSNLDISQDLGRLTATAKQKGWEKVKLAYLGGVDPSAYGLPWEPWREGDLKAPQPGTIYAVNASFFQLAPALYPETMPIATGWLSQASPSGKINDTWYYFEIPGKREPSLGNFVMSVPFQQNRGYAPLKPSP